MRLDIDREEQQILLELLESRARDLHPAIRRSRIYSVADELKRDLEFTQRLLEKVRSVSVETQPPKATP